MKVATFIAVAALVGVPGAAAPQTFAGNGAGGTPPFVLPSGMTPVTVETSDPGFSALLIGMDGSVLAELTAQPRQEVRLPREGRYLFEVRTEGSWRIALEPLDPMSVLEVSGRTDGDAAAGEESTAGWLAKGFGAGLVLGPIGTLLVTNRASRSDFSPGPTLAEQLAASDPVYRDAFREAYADRRRGDRRAAAIVGGLTGTAILGFVILQLTVWNQSSSSSGGSPDPGPAVDIQPAGMRPVW